MAKFLNKGMDVYQSWYIFLQAYNKYSHDLEMVCAILCAGLYPNVVQCKRRGKRTAFYTKEVGKVDIHPSSVNAGIHLFPLPYLVYSEKVKTTSIYIRDSTNISDYALLLFGGNLDPSKNGEGIEMLGGYLHFSASKSVIELIKVIFLQSFSKQISCFFFINKLFLSYMLIQKNLMATGYAEITWAAWQASKQKNWRTRVWHFWWRKRCGCCCCWITSQSKYAIVYFFSQDFAFC